MKWKLVPVEPTPEMIDAWNNDDSDEFRHAYRAMLEAAPQPPEVEPVAKVTGYYAGYLSISTIDGRVLPAGTALYLAQPAPSVPDGWRPFLTDVITAAGLLEHGKRDKGLADRIGSFAFDAMRVPTPTPAEAPADLVRDAERWLSERDLELLVTFGMQADDCDADGHTLSKEQARRLCELGVLRNVGFGRHEMTAFGDSIFGIHFSQGISLPLQTCAEHNAAIERDKQKGGA